jgi:hypothetical protein
VNRWTLATVIGLLALFARPTVGSVSVPLGLDALAAQADVIVLGRVLTLTTAVDPAVDGVYTFVTVDVSEVFKGSVPTGSLAVKQLGGRAGSRSAFVAAQARFSLREQVLLFLRTRVRDGSLFTVGLWQGKWSVEIDAVTSRPAALKVEPQSRHVVSRRPLDDVREELTRLVSAGASQVLPRQTPPSGRVSSTFVLNDPPIRWDPPSVAVDIESGTQPGLSGGGLAQIAAAAGQWNAPGSALTLLHGARLPPRCLNSDGAGILITFNDPCGEISSDPSLLGVTVFAFDAIGGPDVNGRLFHPIRDAVITTSAHPEAREALAIPSCFQAVIAHEIGHAIGLDHSADPTALMYFAISEACAHTVVPLAADDVQGLFTIYPAGTTPPIGGVAPGQPVVTSATALGGILNLAWTAGPGVAPAAHRLDFFSGSTLVASVTTGAGTSIAIPIPPGTAGSFAVQVTPFAGGTAGPPSALFPFTIGGTSGGGGCTGPPSAPAVNGSIVGGTATVSWAPVASALAYTVSAGSNFGAADIMPPTNVGATTSVSASGLPAGFTAWVRVVAVNACGQSAPGDVLLQAASPVGGSFIEFLAETDACSCWHDPIDLEIDGRGVGTMSCLTSAGPFPVSNGPHSYRVCDRQGCLGRTVEVLNSTWSVTLVCR